MKKHLLLSHIAILSSSAMTGIQVMGQLPDTGTPMHLLIDSDIAKALGLLPTKNAKKFKSNVLTDIVEHTQVIGIKFVVKPDLKQLLSADFLGEIGSAKSPDTVVYLGTMPALTGDDDEMVILAVGKQAKDVIDTFVDMEVEHVALDTKTVKQFYTGLIADNEMAMNTKQTGKQPARVAAAT